jgi:hypothetical protein
MEMFHETGKAVSNCLADMLGSLFRCIIMAWRVSAISLATARLHFFFFATGWPGFALACARRLLRGHPAI